MTPIELLSDEEIRNELKRYGVNAAVTSSTRSLLLKKLNRLRSENQNSNDEMDSTKISQSSRSSNRKVIPKFKIPEEPKSPGRRKKSTSRKSLVGFSSDEEYSEDDRGKKLISLCL